MTIDHKPTASIAGFRYEDGFLLTRIEYDAALDDLYAGRPVAWSDLRAHAESRRPPLVEITLTVCPR